MYVCTVFTSKIINEKSEGKTTASGLLAKNFTQPGNPGVIGTSTCMMHKPQIKARNCIEGMSYQWSIAEIINNI